MKRLLLFFMLILPHCIVAQSFDEYYNRGENYNYGKNGVAKNVNEAKKWYQKAAEMGDTRAQLALGNLLKESLLYDEAVKWYQKAADVGDARGQCELGCMYENGYGVLKDLDKAEELYIKSAEQGNVNAQFLLGKFYDSGLEYEKALDWYKKAAEKNVAEAYYNIAAFYIFGNGIPKDTTKAYDYYLKAAELGHVVAQDLVARKFFKSEEYDKALEWSVKAAKQGNTDALRRIGIMYEYGYGVSKDNKKAEEMYKGVITKMSWSPVINDLTRLRQKIENESKPQLVQKEKADSKTATDKIISNNLLAVIISNEDYQQESKVDYAKNDGETFKKCCNKVLGVPEKNIHYVANATLNNIIGELDWLQQACEAFNGEASVIFYYAGHGIPDESSGASYLLPVDGNSRILRTCFSLDELYGVLGKLPAKKVTVLMDACFSGAVRSGGMLAAARGVAIKAKSSLPVGYMIVLSAAQGNETAYKYDKGQHGLFTYFLLKKLNDTNGNVTLGELSEFVTDQVTRHSIVDNGKSQTPSVIISNPLRTSWKTLRLY